MNETSFSKVGKFSKLFLKTTSSVKNTASCLKQKLVKNSNHPIICGISFLLNQFFYSSSRFNRKILALLSAYALIKNNKPALAQFF